MADRLFGAEQGQGVGGGYTVRRHDVSERSQALPKGRLWMGGVNTTRVGQKVQRRSSSRMRCIHPILFEKAIWLADNQRSDCRQVRPSPSC